MALRLAAVALALALIAPAAACADDVVIPAQGRERGTIMFFHGGAFGNAWHWSPARVYDRRSSPLVVVTATGDQFVGPQHATLMQQRGAELVRVPGGHMVSLQWRRPAAAFLRRATRP